MVPALSYCCTAWWRDVGRSHADETAQILDSRYQQKLFGSATEVSKLKTRKSQMLLHVGEEHLDLAPSSS
jgi:hypothetical protein